jgi:hypothetical protein
MKIRNGFVSNSSSSSFLLYGVYLDDGSEAVDGYNFLVRKGLVEEPEVDSIHELYGVFDLEIHAPWGEEVYIGLSWDEVGDDETGREFKERAERLIKRIMPKYTGSFDTHEHAWRDG